MATEIQDPFAFKADPRMYVPRAVTEDALEALTRRLARGEVVLTLAGPAGLGKTLMLHLLPKRLGPVWRCVYLPAAGLAPSELCAAVASSLGLEDDSEAQIAAAASAVESRGGGLVLLVDDGETWAPEARAFLMAFAERTPGLHVLFAENRDGDDVGAEAVGLVTPLSLEEARVYVRMRLDRSAASYLEQERVEAADFEALYDASGGVPARLHQLATAVMRGDVLPRRPQASPSSPSSSMARVTRGRRRPTPGLAAPGLVESGSTSPEPGAASLASHLIGSRRDRLAGPVRAPRIDEPLSRRTPPDDATASDGASGVEQGARIDAELATQPQVGSDRAADDAVDLEIELALEFDAASADASSWPSEHGEHGSIPSSGPGLEPEAEDEPPELTEGPDARLDRESEPHGAPPRRRRWGRPALAALVAGVALLGVSLGPLSLWPSGFDVLGPLSPWPSQGPGPMNRPVMGPPVADVAAPGPDPAPADRAPGFEVEPPPSATRVAESEERMAPERFDEFAVAAAGLAEEQFEAAEGPGDAADDLGGDVQWELGEIHDPLRRSSFAFEREPSEADAPGSGRPEPEGSGSESSGSTASAFPDVVVSEVEEIAPAAASATDSAASPTREATDDAIPAALAPVASPPPGEEAPAVAAERGRLSVNATPWAKVFIDGRSFGETPLGEIELPFGEHRVVAEFPDGSQASRTIRVGADEVFLVLHPDS